MSQRNCASQYNPLPCLHSAKKAVGSRDSIQSIWQQVVLWPLMMIVARLFPFSEFTSDTQCLDPLLDWMLQKTNIDTLQFCFYYFKCIKYVLWLQNMICFCEGKYGELEACSFLLLLNELFYKCQLDSVDWWWCSIHFSPHWFSHCWISPLLRDYSLQLEQ